MPQLKIADVQKQVEALVEDVNIRLSAIELTIEEVLGSVDESTGTTVSSSSDGFAELDKAIKSLRADTAAHVNVYNKHIVEQHKQKKG